MKKTLSLIILILMVFVCFGCTEWAADQHSAWGNFWNNYAWQQQDLTYQQNMQLRDNAREINRQLQQQKSWQERRARQEYYQNWLK